MAASQPLAALAPGLAKPAALWAGSDVLGLALDGGKLADELLSASCTASTCRTARTCSARPYPPVQDCKYAPSWRRGVFQLLPAQRLISIGRLGVIHTKLLSVLTPMQKVRNFRLCILARVHVRSRRFVRGHSHLPSSHHIWPQAPPLRLQLNVPPILPSTVHSTLACYPNHSPVCVSSRGSGAYASGGRP